MLLQLAHAYVHDWEQQLSIKARGHLLNGLAGNIAYVKCQVWVVWRAYTQYDCFCWTTYVAVFWKVIMSLLTLLLNKPFSCHDDIIKRKHFPRYWPFMWGIAWWPVNSLHKGQWRRSLMFSLICAWTNSWVNNRDSCDLRCHRAHYYITVMWNWYILLTSPDQQFRCIACMLILQNSVSSAHKVNDNQQRISLATGQMTIVL